VHLFGARGRIEVVENSDVPAHASMLRGPASSLAREERA
jgi:hypothetical protein